MFIIYKQLCVKSEAPALRRGRAMNWWDRDCDFVTGFKTSHAIPFRVEGLVALSEQGEDVAVEDSVRSVEESVEPAAEDSADSKKTKKKKKKKDKSWDTEAPTGSQVTAESTADAGGIAEVQVNGGVEGKRKKHKRRKGGTEAEEVRIEEVPAVLSDELHSEKKPKKRKREKEAGADVDAKPPRTKKKKKV